MILLLCVLFLMIIIALGIFGYKQKKESEMRRNVATAESSEIKATETVSEDLPVYIQFVSKRTSEECCTYCMTVKTTRYGCYTTYKTVSKDFPMPDHHDKAGCELFLGYPLMELFPKKEQNENRFGILTVDEKNFIQGKLDEGFAYMKEKGRDFHHVVLKTELQADWCMSRTPNAKRTTDLCVEITCEKEKTATSSSEKETYKIEDKTSSKEDFPEKTYSNTSSGGYGYSNICRSNNTRHDGKRWDYEKKEWVEDVPKPNHPIPVLLEGEKLVEIPEA